MEFLDELLSTLDVFLRFTCTIVWSVSDPIDEVLKFKSGIEDLVNFDFGLVVDDDGRRRLDAIVDPIWMVRLEEVGVEDVVDSHL